MPKALDVLVTEGLFPRRKRDVLDRVQTALRDVLKTEDIPGFFLSSTRDLAGTCRVEGTLADFGEDPKLQFCQGPESPSGRSFTWHAKRRVSVEPTARPTSCRTHGTFFLCQEEDSVLPVIEVSRIYYGPDLIASAEDLLEDGLVLEGVAVEELVKASNGLGFYLCFEIESVRFVPDVFEAARAIMAISAIIAELGNGLVIADERWCDPYCGVWPGQQLLREIVKSG